MGPERGGRPLDEYWPAKGIIRRHGGITTSRHCCWDMCERSFACSLLPGLSQVRCARRQLAAGGGRGHSDVGKSLAKYARVQRPSTLTIQPAQVGEPPQPLFFLAARPAAQTWHHVIASGTALFNEMQSFAACTRAAFFVLQTYMTRSLDGSVSTAR